MIKLAEKIIARTGSPSDVYITGSRNFSVEVADGRIENYNINRSAGVGLRIFTEKRVGFAYTAGCDSGSINLLVEQARVNAGNANKDRFNRLPVISKRGEKKSLDLYDDGLWDMSSEDKIDLAKSMERVALKYDKRIQKVFKASLSCSEYEVTVINSEGVRRTDKGTYCSAGIEVIAGDGKEIQAGGDIEIKRFIKDLNVKGLVETACERAISMLGSKKVKSQSVPVIFAPLVSCEFLEVISGSLCADSVQKGKSIFAGRVGKKVASPLLNIIDDGTLKKGVGTSVFDAEGVDTQKTLLIEGGVLKGFLYNDYTANRGGVESTGNAVRSFKALPGVGKSNMIIEAGDTDRKSLTDIKKGVYVFGVMGMHMIDTISGDFSIGINGMWIENGSYSHPVSGVTIAGNINELLNSIDSVANDIKFYGSVGAPSIRIKSLMLSGK